MLSAPLVHRGRTGSTPARQAHRRLLAGLVAAGLTAGAVVTTVPVASAATTTTAGSVVERSVPVAGRLFGAASTPRAGQTAVSSLEGLESQIGRKFDLHRIYSTWDEAQPSFLAKYNTQSGRRIALSIRAGTKSGTHLRWADIAAGKHDAEIQAQARGLQSLGVPVMLTFDHEPEDGHLNGTPAEYVAAWRHYVKTVRATGADNISFAWVMMAWSFANGGATADTYYPGDDVVDWLAADGYNWAGCRSAPWRSFSDVFAPFRSWAAARPKPVFIAEFGSTEDPAAPGRKAAWLREATASMNGWSQVRAAAYFNSGIDCPWWLDSSTTGMDAFREMGADSLSRPVYAAAPTLAGYSAAPEGDGFAVRGTVTPGTSATEVVVEYGTTPELGRSLPVTTVQPGQGEQPVSARVTALAPGTAYYWRLVARSAAGTSVGDLAAVTTHAPAAATTGAVTDVTTTGVVVTGSVASPAGPATVSVGFRPSGGAWVSTSPVAVAQSSSTAVALPVTGLKAGTVYEYQVVVTEGRGSAAGEVLSFRTAGAPVVSGTSPAWTSSGLEVRGFVNPGTLPTTIRVEYRTTSGQVRSSEPLSVPAAMWRVSYGTSVPGLAQSQVTAVRVVATNSLGSASSPWA